jgi:cysteinyl-tRNA synthetase
LLQDLDKMTGPFTVANKPRTRLMPISLYNSLSRRIEPFVPLEPNRVTVYLCGPTVYSYVHIGNARGPVVFDVLVKLLRRHYPQVIYARNITDVDDKINHASLEQGVPIGNITERFAAAYREDMATLGIAPPDIEPFATQHIGQIINMIEALIAGGHAYVAEGHVLFDVSSYRAYGSLSGRDTDELIAGARVEVAPYKRIQPTSCCGSHPPPNCQVGIARGAVAARAGISNVLP